MSVEHWWKDTDREKLVYPEKNLSHWPTQISHGLSVCMDQMGNVRTRYHWRASVQQLFQWKSRKYYICWVCVCSLTYPACNAHASYCHLWPDRHYQLFSYYLIHGSIFEKFIKNKICVLIFSTTCAWNISHSRKKLKRNDHKYLLPLT